MPTVVGALEGIEAAERDTEAGEPEDLERDSSSSFGLRSCEISTLIVVEVFGKQYLKSKVGWACTGLSTCASLVKVFAHRRTSWKQCQSCARCLFLWTLVTDLVWETGRDMVGGDVDMTTDPNIVKQRSGGHQMSGSRDCR